MPDTPRARLTLEEWPAAVYAIGDVHGCLAQLRMLHDKIVADASAIQGHKLIVCCGDYIDRGPDAAGVLDFLHTPPPPGFTRICLAGNHEAMMLDHITDPANDSPWLSFGGLETLASYGIDSWAYLGAAPETRAAMLRAHLPARDIDFLRNLPLLLTLPGVIFVHAGIRPGIPLQRQSEADLLWIRDDFYDTADLIDVVVVHGHTPASEPVWTPHRICVDTGAFATGTLTAVRLIAGQQPKFLEVTAFSPRW